MSTPRPNPARYSAVADTIRTAMAAKNFDQPKLTKRLGCNASLVHGWLACKYAPSTRYRARLAKLLDIDEAALRPRPSLATVSPALRPDNSARFGTVHPRFAQATEPTLKPKVEEHGVVWHLWATLGSEIVLSLVVPSDIAQALVNRLIEHKDKGTG